MKKVTILVLAVTVLITGVKSEEYLSAEEAIKIGLEQNFDIRIARNNLEIARNTAGLGTSGFLPVIDASAGESINRSKEESNSMQSFGDNDARNRFAQVALNWTLFDGFRMFTNKKRFEEFAVLGEYQTRNLIENTTVNLLQAYFNLVQQEQLLGVAGNAVEISRTRLEKEEVRQELGGSSSTDLLNAHVSFNNDREQLINREIGLEAARRELNILLGREPDTPLEVEKEIRVLPLSDSLQGLLTSAEEQNSALQLARQNLRIAGRDVSLARSAFYPNVFLNARYGYSDLTISSINNIFSDIETEGTDAVIGVTLSINLFNGFRDRIELQNAQIRRKNDMLSLEDLKHQIRGLVQQTYLTFQKRLELIELEAENVKAAEQNLELQQDRYDIGGTTSIEFRDAQLNFTRAQNTLIVARFQARISRLQLEQLTGKLDIVE